MTKPPNLNPPIIKAQLKILPVMCVTKYLRGKANLNSVYAKVSAIFPASNPILASVLTFPGLLNELV